MHCAHVVPVKIMSTRTSTPMIVKLTQNSLEKFLLVKDVVCSKLLRYQHVRVRIQMNQAQLAERQLLRTNSSIDVWQHLKQRFHMKSPGHMHMNTAAIRGCCAGSGESGISPSSLFLSTHVSKASLNVTC